MQKGQNIFSRAISLILLSLSLTAVADSAPMSVGLATRGAELCESPRTYRVTHLGDTNKKGSLRAALHSRDRNEKKNRKKSCRIVTFDVAGEIKLTAPITIRSDFVTLDGCSAPGAGITITQTPENPAGIIIDGTHRHTHDVLIQCLRFKGLQSTLKRHKVGEAVLSIDADCADSRNPCTPAWQSKSGISPDGGVSNIAFDRITYTQATDKLTVWGKAKNVSITRSLFILNPLALLVSYYAGPFDLEKRDISIRGNIFSNNNERNPQLRGWIDPIDIRHNIIHAWDAYPPEEDKAGFKGDGYGIRVKNPPGEQAINANIVENLFIPGHGASQRALIYGIQPGADSDQGQSPRCPAQGSTITTTKLGRLFVADNLIPTQNCDQFSTVTSPLPHPNANVHLSFESLCRTLPRSVGTPLATESEAALLLSVQDDCLRAISGRQKSNKK